MLEDLKFIKGNPERLEGICLIYCQNKAGSENPFNPEYPCLAVASDASKLIDLLKSMIPIPPELEDSLLEKFKYTIEMYSKVMFGHGMYRAFREILAKGLGHIKIPEELKEQIREELASIPEEKTGVAFHGCFFPFVGFDPSMVDTVEKICDVMEAPSAPNITCANLIISGYAQQYLATFLIQSERLIARSHSAGESSMLSFRELSPQEFLNILDQKVSELMYIHETGADKNQLIRDLKKLTSGSVLVKDVLNVMNLIETTHPKKIELMSLYLKRAHLLVEEKYEEIPAIDHKIKEVDTEDQPQNI